MSLLQNLPYKEYEKALTLSYEQCKIILDLAKLSDIKLENHAKPGKELIRTLDRRGCTQSQLKSFMSIALNYNKTPNFRPESKLAILIGNSKYKHLSKLATPESDCQHLSTELKKLGFTVVTFMNCPADTLRKILVKVFEAVPNNSYCLVFYAGHGCELYNIKCMLGTDCPQDNISTEHCITENFVLKQMAKCKPELSVFIMDMCRMSADRENNKSLYQNIATEDYEVSGNLIITYSTLPQRSAYERLQIECTDSDSIYNSKTFELKTEDMDRIVPGVSQYVDALCKYMAENVYVGELMDKVHFDVERSPKQQKPIKLQCGVAKRSLHDASVPGGADKLLKDFEKIKDFFIECNNL